jgi:hypothetical protein
LSNQRKRQTQRDTPFGSAPWNPHDKDNERIKEELIEIRDQERDMAHRDGRVWLGLGPRQYCYRLKTRGFIFADGRKLDKEHFRRVEYVLKRMRREPRIDLDWDDVADGRGIEHVPPAFRDNRERIKQLAVWTEQMRPIQLEGQKVVPELMVETEGLYNLIYDLADRYGARARALQGQSSITARRKLAERVARRFEQSVRTRVLCVADYDKHGDAILRAIAADAAKHLRDMGLPVDRILQSTSWR